MFFLKMLLLRKKATLDIVIHIHQNSQTSFEIRVISLLNKSHVQITFKCCHLYWIGLTDRADYFSLKY